MPVTPRPSRVRGFAICIAAALSAGSVAGCSATKDHAVAEADRASGRLVLQFPHPVDYSVVRSGPYIFLRFSRPFTANLDEARGKLGNYLGELRLADGDRVLVMRLTGQPSFA